MTVDPIDTVRAELGDEARADLSDRLSDLIETAFAATVEAEKLAYAGGMRSTLGADLIQAHSALLAAKNRRR